MKGDYYKTLDKEYGVRSIAGLERLISCLERDANVMEIGCGSGHVAGNLRDILPRIVASDLEIHCLRTTQANYRDLKIVSFDAAKPWPFKDECLDLVFSSNLYEHLNSGNLYLEEAKRVLKIGGHA